MKNLSREDNKCGAILVGAQMQFCFARFDSEASTCQGNLLGTVNSAEDCCLPIPRGLGGGGYVTAGSEDCVSCMRFTGKVLATDARFMHNWGKPAQAPHKRVECWIFSLSFS